MQQTISIITRESGLADIAKDFLHHAGLGNNRGPLAVESNLLKGLKKIGARYNLNPKKAELFPKVAVLRSVKRAISLAEQRNLELVVGPNISVSEVVQLHGASARIKFFLVPGQAVKFTFIHYGIPEAKIKIWPVGIDTEDFKDVSQTPKIYDALVYFKRRTSKELKQVVALLKQAGQSYLVLKYGHYSRAGFKKVLAKCRYAVILDGNESQGIAIQEIMSSNLPMFVFDQIYLGESTDSSLRENLQVSSVPYWSEVCGVKVATDTFGKANHPYFQIPDTRVQFQDFLQNLGSFSPRSYILENLELEDQAKKFLEFFL